GLRPRPALWAGALRHGACPSRRAGPGQAGRSRPREPGAGAMRATGAGRAGCGPRRARAQLARSTPGSSRGEALFGGLAMIAFVRPTTDRALQGWATERDARIEAPVGAPVSPAFRIRIVIYASSGGG